MPGAGYQSTAGYRTDNDIDDNDSDDDSSQGTKSDKATTFRAGTTSDSDQDSFVVDDSNGSCGSDNYQPSQTSVATHLTRRKRKKPQSQSSRKRLERLQPPPSTGKPKGKADKSNRSPTSKPLLGHQRIQVNLNTVNAPAAQHGILSGIFP